MDSNFVVIEVGKPVRVDKAIDYFVGALDCTLSRTNASKVTSLLKDDGQCMNYRYAIVWSAAEPSNVYGAPMNRYSSTRFEIQPVYTDEVISPEKAESIRAGLEALCR